jgi:hypothetical protein
MNERVEWIAACAEKAGEGTEEGSRDRHRSERVRIEDLPVHDFPGRTPERGLYRESQCSQAQVEPGSAGESAENDSQYEYPERLEREPEEERERRIYRGRTVAMLRRYMRYSIETGRLPSLLGREFFRSKVTSYIVVTFEKNDVRRNVIERLVNAGTAVVISAAIAMHRLWWK